MLAGCRRGVLLGPAVGEFCAVMYSICWAKQARELGSLDGGGAEGGVDGCSP